MIQNCPLLVMFRIWDQEHTFFKSSNNWYTLIGDVANSKRPLLIIRKVQLPLHVRTHYHSFLPAEVGKSFLWVKI